jgi:hypothetical protein
MLISENKRFRQEINADQRLVPEIIDPVFAKTSQNARFLLSENERFGLVFVKTGSINLGIGLFSAHIQLVLDRTKPKRSFWLRI